jgi:hypothetical protein
VTRRAGASLLIVCSLAASPSAVAGPDSEVASAFDPGDPFDIHVWLDYRFASRRSTAHLRRFRRASPWA